MKSTSFLRTVMYKKIENVLKNNNHLPLQGEILGISGLEYFKPFIAPTARITETTWPEISVLALPYPDNSFDVVITDQILEHIEGSPQQAIDESYRVLKPGGIVIHTTAFNFRIHHKNPVDYWRFTPGSLRYLCRNFSEIITANGWGNRTSSLLLILFPRIANKKISDTFYYPIVNRFIYKKNDPSYAHTVWIIAKK